MSQEGILSIADNIPTIPVDFVTNNGTAVPVLNTLDVLGQYTITTSGSGNTVTISPSSSGYPISSYVVGPVGKAGYQTIQSALNAANVAGGGAVFVMPGTYTENLTLYNNTQVVGALGFADIGDLVIVGAHTPPTSGGFVFRNVTLTSSTDIFSSSAAGSSHLIIGDSAINVTNGYTFNLPNWTSSGKLELYDVNSRGGTNDGCVNNTGGAQIAFFSSAIGAGSGNTMICSGAVSIFTCAVLCPINLVTGSNAFLELNVHLGSITLSNNSTGEIVLCEIDAPITMSSSGSWLISTSTINTSSNPAVAGAGIGTLKLADISFINNANVSNSLNLGTIGGFLPSKLNANGVVISGTSSVSPISSLALTDGQVVIGSSTGAPAAATITAGNGISITNGHNSITIAVSSGATVVETLTGNSGGAISPTAGNINTLGTGSITIAGSGSTLTTQLTGLTNHNVLVGAGTATITNVAPSATSGIPLVSNGASADPSFTTAVVAGGGTGSTSFTAYSVICGGTTSTGALQNVSGVGSANQVLTSNGAGALPTWQAASASGAVTQVNGDSGSATPSAGVLTISAGNAGLTCGETVLFTGSSHTLSLTVSDANANTFIGGSSGKSGVSGLQNTGLGSLCFAGITSSGENVGIGVDALQSLTSGTGQNTGLGKQVLQLLGTGSLNIGIGYQAGLSYTTSESSNIVIGNSGTVSESHVIRIGTQGSGAGQQNACYIAGIEGVSVSNKNIVTVNTSTGQLGSDASVAVAQGGTGATSFTVNGAVISNTTGTGALAAVALANQKFLVGNTSAAPTAKALSINVQTFIYTGSAQTYTPTSGMVYCDIQVVGGGGGGGGCAQAGAAAASAGGGGGGGGYARGVFSAATIGASQTVTIGAAGTAGSAGNNAGGTGGTTSVGALLSGAGGVGGSGAAAGASGSPGAGGAGSGGSFQTTGAPGMAGTVFYTSTVQKNTQGAGGSSFFGGGAAGDSTASGTGRSGASYGGGGAGGGDLNSFNQAGGAGAAGFVSIIEYVIA